MWWHLLASNPAAPAAATVLLAFVLATTIVFLYRFWRRSRVTPEERERRRCNRLVEAGKMGDAQLVEISDNLLMYSYLVRGVEYTASQDISHLRERLPQDFSALGAVSVKYDPRNPANSIVVAEHWSGLRERRVG
ncbi:MAG TPA: hypothetical protein VML19_13175 [Verrucomicrobiae bacterium]|nr:hypothetical protein [Verrucomicrobiae bacterium]